MTRMNRVLVAILIVLAFPTAHMLWADDDHEETYSELDLFDLIRGIIENPDPIPQVHYFDLTLDPNEPDTPRSGHRFDGRPAFEFDHITEDPYLAWSYEAGADHDIAFNTWDDGDWDSKIEFLTSSNADEVDPRMYMDSHNQLYITWWENDRRSRIRFAKRDEEEWKPRSASAAADGRR